MFSSLPSCYSLWNGRDFFFSVPLHTETHSFLSHLIEVHREEVALSLGRQFGFWTLELLSLGRIRGRKWGNVYDHASLDLSMKFLWINKSQYAKDSGTSLRWTKHTLHYEKTMDFEGVWDWNIIASRRLMLQRLRSQLGVSFWKLWSAEEQWGLANESLEVTVRPVPVSLYTDCHRVNKPLFHFPSTTDKTVQHCVPYCGKLRCQEI